MLDLRDDIVGVILAGGKSSRMGQDKALLYYRGKPFIQHIAESLQYVFKNVIIISDHGEQYKFLNLPIDQDVYRDCGPLGGIHSAFIHTHTEFIFITSVDLPLIDTSAIQYLLNQKCNADANLFSINDQIQPLFGLYNRACLEILIRHLEGKQYSVINYLKDLKIKILQTTICKGINLQEVLTNINNIEDYNKLCKYYKD